MQLPDIKNLAGVIRVMRPDMRNLRGVLLQGGVVARFHKLLDVGQDFVELLHGTCPAFCVKAVEGLVVVAIVFRGCMPAEFHKFAANPRTEDDSRAARSNDFQPYPSRSLVPQ